jgi:hypothetical protein
LFRRASVAGAAFAVAPFAGAPVVTSATPPTTASVVATALGASLVGAPGRPSTFRFAEAITRRVTACRAITGIVSVARIALPPEPATLAITAAFRIPAGSQPGRACPPAALVALPAPSSTTAGTAFSITSAAAALAIFSRAVIAGTIRDTHL